MSIGLGLGRPSDWFPLEFIPDPVECVGPAGADSSPGFVVIVSVSSGVSWWWLAIDGQWHELSRTEAAIAEMVRKPVRVEVL